jgi:hypothetical protein
LIDSKGLLLGLNGGSKPNVTRNCLPVEQILVLSKESKGSPWSFRQDLIGMSVFVEHGLEYAQEEIFRHIHMKQIAHTVDEYHPCLDPCGRFGQAFRPETHGKRVPAILGVLNDGRSAPVMVG